MNIGLVLSISWSLIIYVAPTCQFHDTPGFMTLCFPVLIKHLLVMSRQLHELVEQPSHINTTLTLLVIISKTDKSHQYNTHTLVNNK